MVGPDGIQIAVDRHEDQEFQENEQLDYDGDEDEETIFPIPEQLGNSEDENADTVAGEEVHDMSLDSDMIISFKPRGEQNSQKVNNESIESNVEISNLVVGKSAADMTPEELIRVNLALREYMSKLTEKNTVNSRDKDKRVVKP